MTWDAECQPQKFVVTRKSETAFDVDGNEITVSPFGFLELGGFDRIKFNSNLPLTETRVKDMLIGYEQGKQEGKSLGEKWVKQDIKNFLGVD